MGDLLRKAQGCPALLRGRINKVPASLPRFLFLAWLRLQPKAATAARPSFGVSLRGV